MSYSSPQRLLESKVGTKFCSEIKTRPKELEPLDLVVLLVKLLSFGSDPL